MGRGEPANHHDPPKRIRRSLSDWFTGDRISHPEVPDDALTFDALLALRGWGAAEFREATPAFLAAARWALYAERYAPVLADHERTLALPMTDLSPQGKLDLARAKQQAGRVVDALRAVLYPEDDDLG